MPVAPGLKEKLAAATQRILAEKRKNAQSQNQHQPGVSNAASSSGSRASSMVDSFKRAQAAASQTNPSNLFNGKKLAEYRNSRSSGDVLDADGNVIGSFTAGLSPHQTHHSEPSGNTGVAPPAYRQPQVTAPLQPSRPSTGGYQSTYTGPDMDALESQLNSQYAQTQAAALQKLRDALATALQGYNAQETQAHQSAYSGRNAADVAATQNEARTRELMANAGLTGDGQNLTLSAAQGASRLGALNDINQTEANALQDISQKRSLLKNNEAANELALIQEIGADKAAALLDLLKYGDTRAFQVDQSNYGRYRDDINQQFAEDQFDWQRQTDLADLLGVIGGQQTLAAQNQNFNQQMALADLMGTLGGQRTLAGQQADLAQRNANLNAALQYSDLTGKVLSPQTDWSGLLRQAAGAGAMPSMAGQNQQFNQNLAQKQFDEDVRRYGLDHALQVNAQAISRGNANADNTRANDSASFNRLMDIWKATGSAPPGIQGVPEGTPYGGQQPQQEPANLNAVISNINKLYVIQDDAGNPSINNKSGLRTYIISLGLPDDQTDQLLLLYGLPTN